MTPRQGEAFSGKLERALLTIGGAPPVLDQGVCHDAKGRQCRVCWGSRFDYAREQDAKERALEWLWRDLGDPGPAPRFVASPVGRQYRSVSKRKCVDGKLVLLDPVGHRLRPLAVRLCDVEPRTHDEIFHTLQGHLEQSPLRRALNYAIVKSSVESLVVILNLAEGVPPKVLNAASKRLTAVHPLITGILSVAGSADDTHYLDDDLADERKIFGFKDLRASWRGKGFQYSALSFCQVNPWMVDTLVGTVDGFLEPEGGLLDLYCGFGLFALGLSGARPTLGVDVARASIKSAQANARHQDARHCRFLCRDIRGEGLYGWIKDFPVTQAVLDPPRGGPASDLVEHLASLGLKRVVHLVCNIDRLGLDLRAWDLAGYRVERAVALDMFPGSSNLEMVLALAPKERKAKLPNRRASGSFRKGHKQ